MNPVPQVSSAPSNPKAIIRSNDVWIPRRIRTYHKGTGTQSLLVGDILQAVGGTDSCAIKILGLTAWNATSAGQTSNFIFLETEETTTLSGVRVEGTDVGHASHLPGVRINIPDTLARTYNGSNLTTTVVAKVNFNPFTGSTTAEQQAIVDWTILWNLSADQ